MLRNLMALCLIASPAVAQEVPVFIPVPVAEHIYAGGWEHFVGGGVAAFDCSGDGLPELYAAGGTNPAQLFLNDTPEPGATLAFHPETPEALALTGVIGAYPLDIDGDGELDLAVLRVGEDQLLRGLGNCAFEPFDLGFTSADHWTTAFSVTWETGQTLPTLAFGTYVDRTRQDGPFEACDVTLLYRPEGDRYGPPTELAPGWCALSMLFTDWNRDGRADLRVSNDRHYYVRGGEEQMWAMEETPRLYGPEDGWQSYKLWGMGIASRDISGDGFSDVYLTSMGDQKLQVFDHGAGGPVYTDATYGRGTTAHRPHVGGDGRPSTGWHAAFGDVNNDARDDIFVAKGNVEQMPDAAMKDPNSLLIQQEDRTFSEASVEAGIATMERSRGAALADLNLDGSLDLAVINRRAAMEVYQGPAPMGHWLLVRLQAPVPNTGGIGAFIELRTEAGTQTREVTVGGGHAGGDTGWMHFGLGDASEAEVRVIWPHDAVGDWQTIAAGRRITLSP
ncbi:CRTAC1 family protein [Maritimibacter sp. DP1N21-5]|uniref:CRTAC1 family protein n=1 Tax=Maritimibacter sp. DP1N21-5 TaxID=2836867 RepID=UPI001C46193A|nr:CRTAC1 family protein [Maritimibacter sp. DP1N21-5]MBV7408324.1 CRTAC1 family protein [Maritimibacter sp. DP1N21-5]